tara:strand:- start:1691 stop:2062 length:372 start_codon:yes stop_codon:yes gene_type:complete
MRAPNGQGCSLWADQSASIAFVGDVLRNCVEQLEAAVKGQHQIEFRILPVELSKLERMYPELTGAQAQFCALLNDVAKQRDMVYEFSHGQPADGMNSAEDLSDSLPLMYIVCHREVAKAAAVS